ncbi:hypothetical protein WR25_00470 [Diploscapter pachys]|uniref:Uncharacterized protein n=1 Tax=Diploscapter pachys TaxID=2018661 RepID=A0A2A2M512_9BILA|nr:hypothetical protein WR25_00470 [Diploscapter pachys]
MHLWAVGKAGVARQRNRLSPLHALAPLDEQLAGVAIDAGPAATVLDDDQAAQRRDPVAGIGDDAVRTRMDRRAHRDRDLDPVVAFAAAAGAEAADDLTVDRPDEPAL